MAAKTVKTKKTTPDHLTHIPAPRFVKQVGMVKGRNIRLDRNLHTKDLAELIANAGEVYEAIRLAAPTDQDRAKCDIKNPKWVVSSDGHRRVHALRYLFKTGHAVTKTEGGLKPIPVIVESRTEEEIAIFMLQSGGEGAKQNLESLELGLGYKRLRDAGWTIEQIAERFGRQGQHVRQRLYLIAAPQPVIDIIPTVGTNVAENIAFRHEKRGPEFQVFLAELASKAYKGKMAGEKKRGLYMLVQDAIARWGKPRFDAAVKTILGMMEEGKKADDVKNEDYTPPAKEEPDTPAAAQAQVPPPGSDHQPTARKGRMMRERWPNEAQDFTPWLADNLSELGKALRLELELEECEAPVGKFFLDILARDLDSDSPVVIENQLELTNHDHLGKLVTYAAELEAKVIIWIAKKFNSEHKRALNFLNKITYEDRRFFGVEVSIDDSPRSVQFTPKVTPKGWREQTRGSRNRGRTQSRKTRTTSRP